MSWDFIYQANYVYLNYSTMVVCTTKADDSSLAILIKKHELFCDNQECLILEDSDELKEEIHRKGTAPHTFFLCGLTV